VSGWTIWHAEPYQPGNPPVCWIPKKEKQILKLEELWLKDNGKWWVVASHATPVNPNWDTGFVVK
jgi:hypothetical protein